MSPLAHATCHWLCKQIMLCCAEACGGLDLQVLHCVLYPRASFDIPILSIDMVGKGNQVSLCIIDPCPVRSDRSLPIFFRDIALCVSIARACS